MVKTLGLNHINLNVTDLERSERFYLAAFGLEVRFREGDDMVFVGSPGAHDLITLCQAKPGEDRKSTRLNSSHMSISYAVFCLKKKKTNKKQSVIVKKDGR